MYIKGRRKLKYSLRQSFQMQKEDENVLEPMVIQEATQIEEKPEEPEAVVVEKDVIIPKEDAKVTEVKKEVATQKVASPSEGRKTNVAKKGPVKKEVEVKEKADAKTAAKGIKYHVSQNKDENSEHFKKWRVRKQGSTKTIKYFETQKEAIEHADALAKSANSSVVIHKVDGSIRKQDYSKKV